MSRSDRPPADWSWDEWASESEDRNLLAKRLYVVLTEPVNGLGPVLENLDAHLAYQGKLEREGVMFAAGPIADDAESRWPGHGMFIYRAGSRAEAIRLAERDPMHISGARTFTVRSWLLNEGTMSIRLHYSGDGKPEID
jgi:uncharacterized protein